MTEFFGSVTGLLNIIWGRLSYYASYIDAYPILYSVGLLAIMLSILSVLFRLSKL